MDISQLLPLALQGATLLCVVVLLILTNARVGKLQCRLDELAKAQHQHDNESRDSLENMVSEVKDHFEVNLSNLARDSEEIRTSVQVNGNLSQRALELQELAFSEATTGNTRIQDLLSDNHRRQQKLIETLTRDSVAAFRETSDKVRDSIQGNLAHHNDALMKMSESAQRMLSNMSAHFHQLDSEVGVLKKAIATVINGQRQADQMLPDRLTEALAPVGEQQLVALRELKVIYEKAFENHTLLDDAALVLNDLQRSLQSQRHQLMDINDSTGKTQQLVSTLERQQLDIDTFQRRHESLSQELAELSVLMQPMLDITSELAQQANQPVAEAPVAPVVMVDEELNASVDDLKATTLAMSDDWQKALDHMSALMKRRHGELSQHLDQVQANVSSELDSLRHNQRQVSDDMKELQRVLKLLRVQKMVAGGVPSHVQSVSKTDEGLRIETPDSVHYLSAARVSKVEDKVSGQTTVFAYDDSDEKLSSETFENGLLKYRVHYDMQGAPCRSSEFDARGREVFLFEYNPFGELVSKQEVLYDAAGKRTGVADAVLE